MISIGSYRFHFRSSYFTSLILLFGICLISWNILQITSLYNDMKEEKTKIYSNVADWKTEEIERGNVYRPIVWINGHGENIENTYLKHIFDVFRMLGYHVISGVQPLDAKWDVMWIHDYPFAKQEYRSHIDSSSSDQYINHIPGSGYYTSKVSLATANISNGIPQAFQLPQEKEKFLEFAKDHPGYLWVQKNNNHRNIKIKTINEMNLDAIDSFIQRFVDNPLLIDNKKFDIGIYTVVTSLEPLRVHVLDDGLLRFCPDSYHPFDVKNVDKYVVGDDYTPIWEIESLRHFYVEQRLSFKDSLYSYLRKNGKNPDKIWEDIHKTIAEVFHKQQLKMLNAARNVQSKGKMFELSRFDFVLDEDLKVYLMEANMSPNLSSGHFKQNQMLYEQVLFNILSLVGIGSQMEIPAQKFVRDRLGVDNSEVSDRDMSISLPQCYNGDCDEHCKQEICHLCGHCMSQSFRDLLRTVIQEHYGKRKMIRLQFEEFEPQTSLDRLLSQWLTTKCISSPEWC